MQSNIINMDTKNKLKIEVGEIDMNSMLNNINNQGGMDINSMLRNKINNPNVSGGNSSTYSVKLFSTISNTSSGVQGPPVYTTQYSGNVKYDVIVPEKVIFQNEYGRMSDGNFNKIEETQVAYKNTNTEYELI